MIFFFTLFFYYLYQIKQDMELAKKTICKYK